MHSVPVTADPCYYRSCLLLRRLLIGAMGVDYGPYILKKLLLSYRQSLIRKGLSLSFEAIQMVRDVERLLPQNLVEQFEERYQEQVHVDDFTHHLVVDVLPGYDYSQKRGTLAGVIARFTSSISTSAPPEE